MNEDVDLGESNNRSPKPRWPRVALVVAIVAAVGGFVDNLDKIAKFAKEYVFRHDDPPTQVVVKELSPAVVRQLADQVAAINAATSGSAKAEGAKNVEALENAARTTKALLRSAIGPSTPKWMKVAAGEVGQREWDGGSANPRILEYMSSTNLPVSARLETTPWTSAFANWALVQGDVDGTGSADPRYWIEWGEALQAPKMGALVLIERQRTAHGPIACFFLGMIDDSILCLGGNFHDAVSVLEFPSSSVLGYRWPKQGSTRDKSP